MLKIIREDLTCLHNDKEVARYEDISQCVVRYKGIWE